MASVTEIDASDFRRLDEFPLKWRWTDSRWNKLPNDALDAIQPLGESKARELCQYTFGFTDHNGLIESLFDRVLQIGASDESPEIQHWLIARAPDLNQTVVVSWNNDLAALVRWEVFCRYWDDFCYPSSDDVAVFPLSGKWILFYSHDQYFMFGERHISGAA
ncbi:MAG TPA: hypothetical protein VLM38_15145 [Blastocatellia bacterium]|nr:hypothetical protein [Blastocatellia bacterium]